MRVTFEEWFEKEYPLGFYTNDPSDPWWNREVVIRSVFRLGWDARYETLNHHDLTFHDYNDI